MRQVCGTGDGRLPTQLGSGIDDMERLVLVELQIIRAEQSQVLADCPVDSGTGQNPVASKRVARAEKLRGISRIRQGERGTAICVGEFMHPAEVAAKLHGAATNCKVVRQTKPKIAPHAVHVARIAEQPRDRGSSFVNFVMFQVQILQAGKRLEART